MKTVDDILEQGFDYLKLGAFYRTHLKFKRLVKYTALAGFGYVSGLPLMWLFISFNIHWAVANLFSATIIHLIKFLGSDVWVWGGETK